MEDKVKQINGVLAALDKKGNTPNTEIIKKLGLHTATFYALKKKLVMLKRLDPKTFKVVQAFPVSKDELAGVPYPYGGKRKKGGDARKAWKKEMNKHYKRLSDIRQERIDAEMLEKGMLKNPIEIPVRDKEDTITLTYSALAKIIIAATKEGVK